MIKCFLGDAMHFWIVLITAGCSILLAIAFWGVSSLHSAKTLKEIAILKFEIEAKTIDRYHGAEARRDQEALHRHLDRIQKECAK